MDKKRIFNIAGAAIGLIAVLMGIIIIFCPADSYTTFRPDDVSFGADYYTYEYEATRYAALNAGITANNLRELGQSIAFYAGAAFVIAGLLILVNYLGKLLCVEEATPVIAEATPIAEALPEEVIPTVEAEETDAVAEEVPAAEEIPAAEETPAAAE